MPHYQNKVVVFEDKSNSVDGDRSQDRIRLEEEVKNNRKITDYFPLKNPVKTAQVASAVPPPVAKIEVQPEPLTSNPSKSNMSV